MKKKCYIIMNQSELDKILAEHKKWLGNKGGKRANLRGVNLEWTNLRGATLIEADLSCANLSGVNLEWSNLSEADLSGANLSCANLSEAYMREVNMSEADLTGTVLDPKNKPNANIEGFEIEGQYVIGYRTQNSPAMGGDGYEVGESYEAPVFSTCETKCHPGLYLYPTLERVKALPGPYIKVRALISDVHEAGNKWRCKKFEVLTEV